jgi:hypothetical protein
VCAHAQPTRCASGQLECSDCATGLGRLAEGGELHVAAENNDLDAAKALLAHSTSDANDKEGDG